MLLVAVMLFDNITSNDREIVHRPSLAYDVRCMYRRLAVSDRSATEQCAFIAVVPVIRTPMESAFVSSTCCAVAMTLLACKSDYRLTLSEERDREYLEIN